MLTAHQREVFAALALNGVPIDVLAERLSTTRGALYTTLHDARRKLREALTVGGFAVEPATPLVEDPREACKTNPELINRLLGPADWHAHGPRSLLIPTRPDDGDPAAGQEEGQRR